MARTCSAGSALVGPIMKASMPSFWPRSLIPASMALNHGMPPILTTTPTFPASWANATAAPASESDVARAATRIFLIMSLLHSFPMGNTPGRTKRRPPVSNRNWLGTNSRLPDRRLLRRPIILHNRYFLFAQSMVQRLLCRLNLSSRGNRH
ncbi:hypothetical protein D9M72_563400 [compost metagenome]